MTKSFPKLLSSTITQPPAYVVILFFKVVSLASKVVKCWHYSFYWDCVDSTLPFRSLIEANNKSEYIFEAFT